MPTSIGTFDAGDSIVDLRLGKQVLNWGESTFIPNGINAINHFDVSKLEAAGVGAARSAASGRAGVGGGCADRHRIGGGFLPVRLGGDRRSIRSAATSRQHRLRGTGSARSGDHRKLPTNDQGVEFGPLVAAINADLAGYTVILPQLGAVPAPQPAPAGIRRRLRKRAAAARIVRRTTRVSGVSRCAIWRRI